MSVFFYLKNKELIVILLLLIPSCFTEQAKYITNHNEIINDVNIQPLKALKLAEPYIEKHATKIYRKDKPLKTHITLNP